MNASTADLLSTPAIIEERTEALLKEMTLAEKIGQMCQLNASEGYAPDYLAEGLRTGRIGSVLNIIDVDATNELQRIAVEESRLGIPLLVGRDVIHGFKTIMPIPLGQAASWNPDIVREGAGRVDRYGIVCREEREGVRDVCMCMYVREFVNDDTCTYHKHDKYKANLRM